MALDQAEINAWISCLVTALTLSIVSSIFMICIIKGDSQNENYYTYYVYLMSVCLLIYCSGQMFVLFESYTYTRDALTAWILLVTGSAILINYFISFIISVAMYALLTRQKILDIREKSTNFRIATICVLLIILIVYIAMCLYEIAGDADSKFHKYFKKNNIKTFVQLNIRLVLSLGSFIIYIMSEYYIYCQKSLLLARGEDTTSTRKLAAIGTLVKRMRLYPLVQFAVLGPFYVLGCLNNLRFMSANPYLFPYKQKYLGYAIFCCVINFLDSFGMLFIFLRFNWKPVKQFLIGFLKGPKLADKMYDVNDEFRDKAKSSEGVTSAYFDPYHQDYPPGLDLRPKSRTDSNGVVTQKLDFDNEDLSDYHLLQIVTSIESAGLNPDNSQRTGENNSIEKL